MEMTAEQIFENQDIEVLQNYLRYYEYSEDYIKSKSYSELKSKCIEVYNYLSTIG